MHNKHKQGRVIYSIYFLGHHLLRGLVKLSPVHLFACRGSTTRASSVNEDRAEPSELQPHSDSLRSRLNAVSTRYDFLKYNGCANCIFGINLFDINLSCDLDTKNHSQRAQGDGKKGCSVVVVPCQNLVQKQGGER